MKRPKWAAGIIGSCPKKGDVLPPFDVRLPQLQESDEQTSTVVQPDIVVVCDNTKLDHQGCKETQ